MSESTEMQPLEHEPSPWRRSLRFSLVLLACIVSTTLVGLTFAADEPRPLGHAYYAYITANELALVDGAQIVARQSGHFDELSRPIWTADGRYVVTINDVRKKDHPETRELIAIDSMTRTIRRVSCSGCTSVAAVGESKVIANQIVNEDHQDVFKYMARIDLSSAELPAQLEMKFPDVISAGRFLADIDGHVLVAGANISEVSRFGGPEKLYLLAPNGSSQLISAGRAEEIMGNVQMGPVATIPGATRGTMWVAIQGGIHGRDCISTGGIFILDPETGKAIVTDSSAIVPSGHRTGVDAGLYARDLWWGNDGYLYATFEYSIWKSVACDPHSSERLRLWRLVNSRWVLASSERVLAVRQINAYMKAAVIPNGDTGGILYTDVAGKRIHIADHVTAISVPTSDIGQQTNVASVSHSDVVASNAAPAGQPSCDKQQFLNFWHTNHNDVDTNVSTMLCRQGYAYVVFTGPNVAVHGTQAVLFHVVKGRWADLVWGSTSQGNFNAEDMQQVVDPRQIAAIFPEAGIVF